MAIDTFIAGIEKETKRLERDLYDEIMAIVIGLMLVDGKVVSNVKNYAIVGKVDDAFKSFDKKFQKPYIDKVKKELVSLERFYINYLDGIGVKSKSLKGFRTLLARMDSYLDSVALIEPVKIEVKNYLMGAISSHRSLGGVRSGLREILGLRERTGALDRYYRGFLYDSIAQFDAMINNAFAEQNNLNYFVYKGGLIETSREFCIKRNGLVFRRDQVGDWKNDPTLPGYPNVADYDPIIDRGRWNCRHYLLWITDEQAKEMLK